MVTSNFHEPRQCRQRSGNHGIKAVAGCIVLAAGFHGRNIVETQQSCRMLRKHDLLVIAVEQREVSLGHSDCERQARKPCARSDIKNGFALKQRRRDKAIDEMRCDHLVRVADGR